MSDYRAILDSLRVKITELDTDLLTLLAQRQSLTNQVAETKINAQIPVRDVQREEALLVDLIKNALPLGLTPQYVTKLFHVVIEESVLNQQKLLALHANPRLDTNEYKVAFLGDKGSYSYLATQKYFARRGTIQEIGCGSFKQIIETVETHQADYAVLPIENTSSGSINEVYDQLQHTNLSIVGELTHPVKHALLVTGNTDINTIKTLYAHPQVFAQCSQFIEQLNGVELKPCEASSDAMAKVKALDSRTSAAIASEAGGKIHGLTVIKDNLANQKENHSRFIVVASEPEIVPLEIPAKTTLIMSTIQKPGALVDALLVLKKNNINMTKLESRPINGNPWEEMFYIDVQANLQDGPLQTALEELKATTRHLNILGCYPSEDISATKVPMVESVQFAGNKDQ